VVDPINGGYSCQLCLGITRVRVGVTKFPTLCANYTAFVCGQKEEKVKNLRDNNPLPLD